MRILLRWIVFVLVPCSVILGTPTSSIGERSVLPLGIVDLPDSPFVEEEKDGVHEYTEKPDRYWVWLANVYSFLDWGDINILKTVSGKFHTTLRLYAKHFLGRNRPLFKDEKAIFERCDKERVESWLVHLFSFLSRKEIMILRRTSPRFHKIIDLYSKKVMQQFGFESVKKQIRKPHPVCSVSRLPIEGDFVFYIDFVKRRLKAGGFVSRDSRVTVLSRMKTNLGLDVVVVGVRIDEDAIVVKKSQVYGDGEVCADAELSEGIVVSFTRIRGRKDSESCGKGWREYVDFMFDGEEPPEGYSRSRGFSF